MTQPTLTTTESNIFQALGNFITACVATGTVVQRGQGNRVAPPSAANYVEMIPLHQERLASNLDLYQYTNQVNGTKTAEQDTKVDVQVDFYGPASADNGQIVTTLFWDEFACDNFAVSGFNMQPLYASSPQQVPFSDSNQQVEEHWYIVLTMQVNPIVTMVQQFANHLGPVGINDVI